MNPYTTLPICETDHSSTLVLTSSRLPDIIKRVAAGRWITVALVTINSAIAFRLSAWPSSVVNHAAPLPRTTRRLAQDTLPLSTIPLILSHTLVYSGIDPLGTLSLRNTEEQRNESTTTRYRR